MKSLKSIQSNLFIIILTGALSLFVFSSCNQSSDSSATAPSDNSGATASATPVSMTVQGEVLDMSCYMKDGSTGMAHQSCAQGCLNKGLPAGILSKNDGQVYLLIEDHKKADAYKTVLEHAAQNVEITGTVISKNGVQSLLVEDVKVES